MKPKSGMADSSDRPRIVIVGAGFAGFHCARALDRRLGSTAELILVNPVDHMVYSALLPEVVGGVVDPRCVATPLAASLPSTRVLIGAVTAVDIAARTCTVRAVAGRRQVLAWDRLVLNPGSVTGTFGVAGVVEHARGFKTLAEALYLREEILRQLQLAGATDDAEVRRGHATFVVVGGGFTGLELAAQGAALAQEAGLELGGDVLGVGGAAAVAEDEHGPAALQHAGQRGADLGDDARLPLQQEQLHEGALSEAILDLVPHVHSWRTLRMISLVEMPFTSGASSTRPAWRRPTTSLPL